MPLVLIALYGFFSANIFAVEGFNPLGDNNRHQGIREAVVKISIPMKMDFGSDRSKEPYLDAGGSVVITPDLPQPSLALCENKDFASSNYYEDACKHLKAGGNLLAPIPVRFSGSGYYTHQSGKVVTAEHLIDVCKLFVSGDLPFYCPIIETEVTVDGNTKTIKGAHVLAWGKSDGSIDKLDYALLAIDHQAKSVLRVCQHSTQIGSQVELYGFPVTSNRPTQGRYNNADGSLRVSRGRVLPTVKGRFSLEIENYNENLNNYLFIDADMVGGNSGGPLLSQDDCVTGIAKRALNQGDQAGQNVNTAFMLSTSNPGWALKIHEICNRLFALGLNDFVSGCETDVLYQGLSRSQSESAAH